ncbi:MAG: serine hydrolase [Fidelibacterota bacterium]|nr:MAG: serine hydrolase [Candidatus Neomarinimicrobiota bacterium]
MYKQIIYAAIAGFVTGLLLTGCSPEVLDSEYQSDYPLAEEEGLNGKALEWLVKDIETGKYGEVRSLVVRRNERTVLEEYFRGYSQDDLQPLHSITKSVLSALFGIAVDQGYIDSLDKPILDYFGEYETIQNGDSWKESITLRHLLSMSAGLEWNELAVPYSDYRNVFNSWRRADDEIKFVLDRPVISEPGTAVNYNSGLSQLLSVIFTKETGQSASDFAATNLFNHLGITEWTWSASNDSISDGYTGLRLRSADLAKFGQLYLQQGSWDGVQVIPEEWVTVSTDSLGIMSIWTNYGYQWWCYSSRMAESGMLDSTGIYFGAGYGGQILWIIPYYGMTALVTAANSDDFTLSEAILWEYLLRMIQE